MPNPNIKEKSMFTMDDVHFATSRPLNQAQERLLQIVEASNANMSNKHKARKMIMGSRSSSRLAQGVANFILAHPSEGLKGY